MIAEFPQPPMTLGELRSHLINAHRRLLTVRLWRHLPDLEALHRRLHCADCGCTTVEHHDDCDGEEVWWCAGCGGSCRPVDMQDRPIPLNTATVVRRERRRWAS